MIRRLAPLFSLGLALSCGSPTATVEPFELGEPFWLAAGETAVSADGGTVVTFTRILTDSRCPSQAVCVWAGEAIIELQVMTPSISPLDPARARLRSTASAGDATHPDPTESSVAPAVFDVKVGDSEPLVAGRWRLEALWLDEQVLGATGPNARRARLRVDTLP